MSPVTLTYVITELDPGGAEKMLTAIATRLDRARWSPRVISLSSRGAQADELEAAGIPVTCLNATGLKDVWATCRRLTWHLRDQRPQIVHAWLFHANILSRWCAQRANVPVLINSVRVAERRSWLYSAIDRGTAGNVWRHVCVSEGVARHCRETIGLSESKLVVIPNGVDLAKWNPPAANPQSFLASSSGVPVILFVGRIEPQKDLGTLLTAVKELVGQNRTLQLLVVGDGPDRHHWEQWVATNQLTESVRFVGRQNDLSALYRSSTLLVLPSLWEGMPNVVLEAMASGLPVICTPIEGSEELIHPNETGLLVPFRKPHQLAAAIGTLLDHPEQRTTLSLNAQKHITKHFTIDACVRRHEELYAAAASEHQFETAKLRDLKNS